MWPADPPTSGTISYVGTWYDDVQDALHLDLDDGWDDFLRLYAQVRRLLKGYGEDAIREVVHRVSSMLPAKRRRVMANPSWARAIARSAQAEALARSTSGMGEGGRMLQEPIRGLPVSGSIHR